MYERAPAFVSILLAALGLGCMSLSTNTTLLSDSSHLGTPYSGARGDLHTLVCYGRGVSRDATGLFFAPLMLIPLVDLPLSAALDTLFLPLDVALEPDRPPQRIGGGGCRLFGM
ncbi:MAG TPA: YceK/YidQ family lipoprotein [Myxococcota bacterium]